MCVSRAYAIFDAHKGLYYKFIHPLAHNRIRASEWNDGDALITHVAFSIFQPGPEFLFARLDLFLVGFFSVIWSFLQVQVKLDQCL